MNLLNTGLSKSQETKTQATVECFWRSFDKAIQINKRGLNGKQRILSIIVENFEHKDIQNNLQVTFK